MSNIDFISTWALLGRHLGSSRWNNRSCVCMLNWGAESAPWRLLWAVPPINHMSYWHLTLSSRNLGPWLCSAPFSDAKWLKQYGKWVLIFSRPPQLILSQTHAIPPLVKWSAPAEGLEMAALISALTGASQCFLPWELSEFCTERDDAGLSPRLLLQQGMYNIIFQYHFNAS